jgi:hypothetical protein
LEHSCSLLIVGVIRLHGFKRLCLSMMKAVALNPMPKRHINLVVGRRSMPPPTLKLWRAWMFLSWSAAKMTLLMSETRV